MFSTGKEQAIKTRAKKDFPVSHLRQILEPGPIVLVASKWKGRMNIMTMGWHTVMEFTPSLLGCIIASSNHSFEMIRKSRECTINVPTADMAVAVVGIGNCSGENVDKFDKYNLTPMEASKVKAPLIKECFASFECRLHDTKLVNAYNFFIWEVVKAHVAATPKYPKTLHFYGQGIFSVPGDIMNLRRKFTKWKDI